MNKKKYKITFKNGLWFVESKELLIIGYGETKEDLIKDYEQHITYYKKYARSIKANKE